LPVAVDAVGGDHAPHEIVAGAAEAAENHGIDVVLIGPPQAVGDTRGLELVGCTEVIDMHEEGARAVRRKKAASPVVGAELVRDGRACALVSAGNTGAAVAAALLRMGRIRGVSRPAIATPLPVPGATPTVLLDAGANPECQPQWLVQFAQMGAAYARARFGIAAPRVALLSNGEEATKGTATHRAAYDMLSGGEVGIRFVGNVEGGDLLSDAVDVAVTDGFTGNLVLKGLEGATAFVADAMIDAVSSAPEAQDAAPVLVPTLRALAEALDPETYGGAMLLGVNGVCIIGHGSSSARAIVNAVVVAREMVDAGLVDTLARSIHPNLRQ
jgi:glycerol-3-phosphate acyltransferase PlsX